MKSKMLKKVVAMILCMVIVLSGAEYMRAGSVDTEVTETTEGQTSEEEIVLSEENGEQPAADGEETQSGEAGEAANTEAGDATEAGEEKQNTADSQDTAKTGSETSEVKAQEDKSTDAVQQTDEKKTDAAQQTDEKKTDAAETEVQKTEAEKSSEELQKEEELKKLAEQKPIMELTYEDSQVSIKVTADKEGNIPQGASLSVTPIEKKEVSSDMNAEEKAEAEEINAQYDATAEKLQEKAEGEDYDILGFLAYDITFVDKDGNKLEPNGSVSVSMDYKEAAIPDEVKEAKEAGAEVSDVTLMHLEEDEQGEVKDVVDMVADESQTAEVKTTEATEVQKVEFQTESFSTFVLTWGGIANISLTIQVVDESGAPITFFSYTDNWTDQNDSGVAVSNIGLGKGKGQDLENYTFKKATVGNGDDKTEIKYLKYDSGWKYATDDNKNWTDLDGQQVYFVYSTEKIQLKDLGGNNVTSDQLNTMIQGKNQGSLPIAWKRSESYEYTTRNNDNSGLNWKWSGISANSILSNLNITNEKEIWDGSRSGTHYLNDYLNKSNTYTITASDDKLYDSATWKIKNNDGQHEIMTRFQGTFDLKSLSLEQGYTYQDYDYTIKSVLDNEKIFINDNLFVFVYPKTVTLTDENYMNYLAFWTGTSNRGGSVEFNGKKGTQSYYGTDNSIWSKLTDTWYAEPVEDGAGGIIQKALQDYPSNTEFYIDVITHDNATGGGMYRMIINATCQNKTPVSFYKVDADNINRGIEGAKFTLTDDDNPDTNYTFTSTATGLTDTYLLKDGSYTLTEKQAPDGYQETANQWTVTVQSNSFTISAKKDTYTDDLASLGTFATSDNRNGSYYITNKKNETPDPTPDEDAGGEPVHTKTIEKKEGDNYRLTLTVKGEVGEATPIDVLLIVDKSSSMSKTVSSNKSRMQVTKDAISSLIDALKESEIKDQIQVATVTFGRTATTYKNWTAISEIDSGSDYVGSLSAYNTQESTGTNWQAGVMQGNTLLGNSERKDAKRYVIFLTDGEPTRYGEDGEHGNGNSSRSQDAFDNAKTEWNQDTSKIKNASKYIIDASGKNANEDNWCYTFADAVSARYLSGTSEDNIKNAFGEIAKDITRPEYKKVSITDTLSEYAEFAAVGDRDLKVYKQKNDKQKQELNSNDYTVTWDETNKSVIVALLGEAALEDGVTYSIEFNIKPTEKAYAAYALNGGYTEVGDSDTDTTSTITSSGQSGFRSNADQGAYVTYTLNDKEQTAYYKHPVLQVDAETVKHSVKKVWVGGSESSVSVRLTAKYNPNSEDEDGKTDDLVDVPDTYKALSSLRLQTQYLNATNEWTYTWKNLPKYYYYEDADGTIKKAEIQYSVTELDSSSNYQASYKESTADDGTPLTTITNTAKTKWQIVKVSSNSNDVKLQGAEFTLTKAAVEGQDPVTYTGVSREADGVVVWYSDSNKATEVATIPAGTYTLAETKAPGGYSLSAETWNITVADDGTWTVTAEDSSGGAGTTKNPVNSTETQTDSEGNETSITVHTFYFSDTPLYSLPSTGGIGTYWYTIGGILLMLAAALMLYRRTRDTK